MRNWIGLLIISGVILLVKQCIKELFVFRTTHYIVKSPKLAGLKRERKILMLSDLHNRTYGKGNARLLKAITDEKPDLILIAGDMLVGKSGASFNVAASFVSELPKICPVYYGNGNHEQRMKERQWKYGDAYVRYKNMLTEKGVQFIENDKVDIWWDQAPVEIRAIEIPYKYYKKKNRMNCHEVSECIGEVDSDKYQILIAHNPGHFEAYRQWGADLILSGHLHGGMIRIPKIGGVLTTQGTLFPKYSGELTKHGDSVLIVGKGLGTHTIHIRLFNRPEIVAIHLSDR